MLKKSLSYILLSILFISCVSKSIIQNGDKYYYEVNTFEHNKDRIQLTQDVVFNNVQNGLHSWESSLTIEFIKKSMIVKNREFVINNTSEVKVDYTFNSNRTWDLKAKSIKGKIKILDTNENFIIIKENFTIIDQDNEIIKYRGIRKFNKAKGSEHNYRKMKRNGKNLWIIKNKG